MLARLRSSFPILQIAASPSPLFRFSQRLLTARGYSETKEELKEELKVDTKVLMRLRKETEISMQLCKKAVVESRNDYKKAHAWLMDHLKLVGEAKSVKLAGRPTKEGQIVIIHQGSRVALVELNCETDFVSKNSEFQGLAAQITRALLAQGAISAPAAQFKQQYANEELRSLQVQETNASVDDAIKRFIGKFGENLQLNRGVLIDAACIPSPNPVLGIQHHNSNIAAVVIVSADLQASPADRLSDSVQAGVQTLANKLASQVIGCGATDVDTLLGQAYLFDESLSVAKVLAETSQALQTKIHIIDLVRIERGVETAHEA